MLLFQAPFWVFLLCAVGLFLYQSLDAIDGKQARRTNSSSPLGELFDHGCDSVSTVFVALGACIAVRLGTNPDWMFFCCFVGMFLFYCAHWQTYVSGMLKFATIDVTEVQISIIILLLLSACGGTTMWDSKIPWVDLSLKTLPVLGIVCGAIYSSFNYFRVIFGGGVGKNGSTIAGTSVLSPGLHIGLIITLAIVIYKKSTTHLFENHPCLYVLTFGFVSAKITQKLVVAHMTKSEIYLQDTAFIGPGLLFLNQYFNSFIDEYIVLWIALFISLFDLLRYATGVCMQIAAHLHIHVFKISSQQAPEQVHTMRFFITLILCCTIYFASCVIQQNLFLTLLAVSTTECHNFEETEDSAYDYRLCFPKPLTMDIDIITHLRRPPSSLKVSHYLEYFRCYLSNVMHSFLPFSCNQETSNHTFCFCIHMLANYL
uniref:Cholinephosphotransferase 1 n=1 Tax=Crocodylus porosus TaxID=8502 RepID=A0A7M4FKY0_CROPO